MRIWLGLAAGVAAAVWILMGHLELRGDVTHFLPEAQAGTARSLSRALATSELPRGMVVSIGAAHPEAARAAAREWAERVASHPEVVWVRTGPDPDLPAALFDLYFPRRHDFLCGGAGDPGPCLEELLGEEGLRSRLKALRSQLAMPGAGRVAALAARDPLGVFDRIVSRVRGTDPGLRLEAGQFAAVDGDEAMVLLQSRPPAFDTARQGVLLDALDQAFAELQAANPAAELVMESSGVNRFAVGIEGRMREDTLRIGLVSLLGVGVLFLLFFRSPAALVLALLPGALGILGAMLLASGIQGELDLLTLAFGASLTGVAIDYAIHLIHHQRLAGPTRTPAETARRLRPSLLLGAGTTFASFAGLTLTDFPGFREMGFFAMAGIAIALATTLLLLPHLLGQPQAPSPGVVRLAEGLGDWLGSLRRYRRSLSLVPLVAVLLAAWAWPYAKWSDDLRGLSEIDPGRVAEDARVRSRLSSFDASRLALVSGPTEAAALRANDQLFDVLQKQVEEGVLEGARSLHAFAWDPQRVARHREAFHAGAPWRQDLETVAKEEGFRSGAFDAFLAETRAEPPAPLTVDDLRMSPLSSLVAPMIFQDGERHVAVTYLRGVTSLPALTDAIRAVDGAEIFDQGALIDGMFGDFRATTLRQIGVGSLFVVAVLALRYRRLRPTLAAFLPSITAALFLLAALVASGTPINLLHAISLLLVMGMGVDYGIFLVDSSGDRRELGGTLLSLLVACLTTLFVFGTLAISPHPALRAIGVTTGAGVVLCFLLAPVAWAAHAEGRDDLD